MLPHAGVSALDKVVIAIHLASDFFRDFPQILNA